MKFPVLILRTLAAVLALAIAVPRVTFAQDAPPATAQPSTEQTPQQSGQSDTLQSEPASQQPSSGTGVVDPSAPPLAPTQPPAEQQQLPSAPSSTKQGPNQPPSTQPAQEPLGTAAAESIRTVGGGASRPAGTAIAPAKQKQSRSLLIKIGALAAVGVAAGVVYGLTRATSSVPPNTR